MKYLLPIMGYHASLDAMRTGRVNHRPDDVVCFGTRFGRKFYIDQRTQYKSGDEPDVVYPLGHSKTDHWFWICPTCGRVHFMSRKQIKDQPYILCGNFAAKYKRYAPDSDGRPVKIPPKPIKLIADNFGW